MKSDMDDESASIFSNILRVQYLKLYQRKQLRITGVPSRMHKFREPARMQRLAGK